MRDAESDMSIKIKDKLHFLGQYIHAMNHLTISSIWLYREMNS